MMNTASPVTRLFSIRNQYGKETATEKLKLLQQVNIKNIKSKKAAQSLYTALLFLQAYPDNKIIYKATEEILIKLHQQVEQNAALQYNLYNSGLTGTTICAAFSFEMVKWLRRTRPSEIKFNSFEADDDQIQAFISVIMSKAESEIFQDGNAEWKSWLKDLRKPDEDILDQLIAIFDSTDIRPEVKDEIWNAIGINVEIKLTSHCCLPASLVKTFYHRSLLRKNYSKQVVKPVAVKLNDKEAEQIIDCSRMIMIRHLREIDPSTFTSAKLVSYYHLQRGISIALMEMVAERRHPIDSYMGYTVFKNGLPVAYAGSWILFDSGRIGLNVFPDYRGGETRYIFEQVLQLHAQVYHLKRFTVDPYQIGKDNSDGIRSGAFWVYYHAGFRPVESQQREIAANEAARIKAEKKYRTAAAVLKTLAESRMELKLQKNAAGFDATDLSRLYANIIAKKYKGDRVTAEKDVAKKLASILQIKNYQDASMNFVLKNWALFLLCKEKEIRKDKSLKQSLKTLFNLKATGSEEAYINALQKNSTLRKLIEEIVEIYMNKS
ncbi:MAG: hypothetical protein JNM14_02025 [Ferruginibacter sp.]|nr:hypothetical protein [Ferruginibacter sp.]